MQPAQTGPTGAGSPPDAAHAQVRRAASAAASEAISASVGGACLPAQARNCVIPMRTAASRKPGVRPVRAEGVSEAQWPPPTSASPTDRNAMPVMGRRFAWHVMVAGAVPVSAEGGGSFIRSNAIRHACSFRGTDLGMDLIPQCSPGPKGGSGPSSQRRLCNACALVWRSGTQCPGALTTAECPGYAGGRKLYPGLQPGPPPVSR